MDLTKGRGCRTRVGRIEEFVAAYRREHRGSSDAVALAEWLRREWQDSNDAQVRELAGEIDRSSGWYVSAFGGSAHEALQYAFEQLGASWACSRWKTMKNLLSKRQSRRRRTARQAWAILNARSTQDLVLD